MPYGKIYEVRFQATHVENLVIVRIYDKETFNADPLYEEQVIPLNDSHDRVPEGNLRLETVDNDEDKYTSIKGTQAVFSFFSDLNYNLNLFIGGEDDRWVVKVFLNSAIPGNLYFRGFLVTSGLSEAFGPTPNIVELTATDNLGLGKDVALVDPDGINPKGRYKIIEFISMAIIAATGVELPIAVINNIKEQSAPTLPWYESCYLDAKTFEAEIGVSEDCYTVLQKILGEDSFLMQWQGYWWIIRIDEMDGVLYHIHSFDADGTYTGTLTPQDFSVNVQSYTNVTPETHFINESATVQAELRYKEVIHRFDYINPQETVDNINFDQGSFYGIVSIPEALYVHVFPTLIDFPATGDTDEFYKASATGQYYRWDGSNYITVTISQVPVALPYHLNNWIISATPPMAPTSTAYIMRTFKDINQTYEKERFVRIIAPTSATNHQNYIQSNPIPIGKNDKANISVDFRYEDNMNIGTVFRNIFTIYILGNDGKYYLYDFLNNEWDQHPSLTGLSYYITYEWDSDTTDERDWQTVSQSLPKFPVEGEMYICLISATQLEGGFIHYKNLSFDYIPFINGDYSTYSGHTNKVSQDGNYKAKRETTVYIGDSPKKLFKGAVFTSDGRLAKKFFDGREITTPTDDDLHLLGWIYVQGAWNQYRREFRIIDADLKNLKLDDIETVPDLLHKYYFVDPGPHTNHKTFLLLHKSQDFDGNMISGRWIEVYDSTNPKVYTDNFQFRYNSE